MGLGDLRAGSPFFGRGQIKPKKPHQNGFDEAFLASKSSAEGVVGRNLKGFAGDFVFRVAVRKIVIGGELDGAGVFFDGAEQGFELREAGDGRAATGVLNATRAIPGRKKRLQILDARGVHFGQNVGLQSLKIAVHDLLGQSVGGFEQVGAAEIGAFEAVGVGNVKFLIGARLNALKRLSELVLGEILRRRRGFANPATTGGAAQKAARDANIGVERRQKLRCDLHAVENCGVVKRVERRVDDLLRTVEAVHIDFVDRAGRFARRHGSVGL